ncbi:hypothetical protein M434DRAFT_379786 [Hypoxylon sp. CO27-5]|nr:hypothetical protein M434DRAFT_379786 [Hypoxylon sp. CO27-5]
MGFLHVLVVALPLVSPSLAADVCGASGISLQLPYFTTIKSSLNYASACGTHCIGDSKCQSYAVGNGFCLHFTKATSKIVKTISFSPFKFYDRICAPVKVNSATSTTSPTATSGGDTSTITIDVGGVITTPNIQTTDSPPLPSSDVVFPTSDKSFTVTYTYEDDPLPTVVSLGTPPLEKGLPAPTTGLPDLPCVIDPTNTEDQFNILGSNFVPLVSQAGNKLQPLPAPTSEAQAKAMGAPDDYVLPAFFFQKPASAPAGIYDIVLSGKTLQYVAKTSQGGLVLTTSSTGTTPVRRNGQTIVTSIFGVDCKGRLTVTQNGSPYTWDISADGTTTTFTAGKAASNRTMVAYSLQKKAATKRKFRKRNMYTTGQAPRCPNSPPDLVAKVFPGARGLNPNGCGPANGIDFVPDFSFGSCCNGHDNCYDNCEQGTFESCNDDFHSCMRGSGCAYLDHWYSYVGHLACLKAADFYAWAVGTSSGRDAFHSATKERCGCYCNGSQGLCGRADGDYQCTSMFGTDVNNCGACGRTCSPKAKCAGGSCACMNDQCGDRCVDLRTHPSNCGSCGNKCSTGYCFEGQCYDPPPDKCVPMQGFTNGDFSQGGNAWSQCSLGCNFFGGGIDFVDQDAYFSLNGPGSADIITTAKMCPGQAYEVSFSIRRSSGNNNCDVKYKFGNRGWSQSYSFPGAGNYGTKNLGPYNAPVFQKGDSDATVNGLSLDVAFTAQVTCTGSNVAWVVLDDFDLVPAQ